MADEALALKAARERRIHRLAALAVLGWLPHAVCAQGATPAGARESAGAVRAAALRSASSVQASTGCDIIVLGTPGFDPSSGRWLVAYTASGNGCDAADEALRGVGAGAGMLFYRRPTQAQVDGLVAGMIRSVESAFVCRINVTRAPKLQAGSGHWVAAYRASGADCMDAAEELGRQGAPLGIYFQPLLDRRDLIQGGVPQPP